MGKRRSDYHRYLNSDRWAETRRRQLERANHTCLDCGTQATSGLHVHHLTYVRFGFEFDSDLVVLCKPCHKKRHKHEKSPKAPKTALLQQARPPKPPKRKKKKKKPKQPAKDRREDIARLNSYFSKTPKPIALSRKVR